MKHSLFKRFSLGFGVILGFAMIISIPLTTFAISTTTSSSTSKTATANSQARLQQIINRGNSEINRRLTTLNGLSSKIASATKLTSSDQNDLTTVVNNEISGLTNLKTTLDSETQVTNAITDAQSIFSDYRVFALVVPQTDLIKTADDQQVTETKLSTLSSKIQADITSDQTAGKNVTNLQTQLNALVAKIQAAQTISNSIETSVITLTPSDYNTNHSVLSGDRNQLKTAQSDIVVAITEAKSLVSSLKSV